MPLLSWLLDHWRDILLVLFFWEVTAGLHGIRRHLAYLTSRVDWQTAHMETLSDSERAAIHSLGHETLRVEIVPPYRPYSPFSGAEMR